MNVGEKIKALRKKENLSQEEFAEKLNVSRSAVAKWESNNGIPEIGNLKMLSEFFSVSIDSLLDDGKEAEEIRVEGEGVTPLSTFSEGLRDIELTGWNDGIFGVFVFAEDSDFYFYQSEEDGKRVFGMVGKKYVQAMTPSGKANVTENHGAGIDRNYFCNRPVLLERAHREGVIRGFFDFRNDDTRNVRIQSFDSSELRLEFGGAVSISEICRIEELA